MKRESSKLLPTVGLLIALSGSPSPATAHHSFAVFDRSKSIEIDAVVEDFQWTNPHCWLDVVVATKGSGETKWALEGPSPAMLRRKGWSKERVKPGDKLKVSFFPTRDGANSGSIRNVTLSDGTVLWANANPDDSPSSGDK
jgi:hypothetical protein